MSPQEIEAIENQQKNDLLSFIIEGLRQAKTNKLIPNFGGGVTHNKDNTSELRIYYNDKMFLIKSTNIVIEKV